MNGTSQPTDWASIIGTANAAALEWYRATRPIGGQIVGAQASVGAGSVQASASLSTLMIGAIVVVAIVLVWKS